LGPGAARPHRIAYRRLTRDWDGDTGGTGSLGAAGALDDLGEDPAEGAKILGIGQVDQGLPYAGDVDRCGALQPCVTGVGEPSEDAALVARTGEADDVAGSLHARDRVGEPAARVMGGGGELGKPRCTFGRLGEADKTLVLGEGEAQLSKSAFQPIPQAGVAEKIRTPNALLLGVQPTGRHAFILHVVDSSTILLLD